MQVRHRVGPLLSEVRSGNLATSEGVSYLEAKHLLLLQYCTSIVFYLMLKAEGRPVKDHPVIARCAAATLASTLFAPLSSLCPATSG